MKIDISAFLKRYGSRQGAADIAGDPHAALAQLDQDRQATRDAIAAAHAKRRGLLLWPNTDLQITKIDRDIDRLNLLAERFDAAEGALIEACREKERQARAARLSVICSDYAAALEAFRTAMHAAADARARMIELRGVAQRQDFRQVADTYFNLPAPMLASHENADRFVDAVLRLLNECRPPEKAPVYNMQVVRRIEHYLPGDRIGLPAAEAREFVDLGAAVPAAGTRLPAAAPAPELPIAPAHVDGTGPEVPLRPSGAPAPQPAAADAEVPQ